MFFADTSVFFYKKLLTKYWKKYIFSGWCGNTICEPKVIYMHIYV